MSLMMMLATLLMPAAPQDEKPAPKIELRGCMKVEGSSFRQGQVTKYTGDTFLVKIAFTDEKGEAWQPTPTLNFNVYNGNEPYQKAQRIVTREQWKADAMKINKDTVVDKTIAFDKKAGELWVAFVRADPGFDPKIDLTLEVKGTGTWVWKGIDLNSEYKVPAKGPDKK